MGKPKEVNYWTVERITKEARKYNHISDFSREKSGAYAAAGKIGIIAELKKQFIPKKKESIWSKQKILSISKKLKILKKFHRKEQAAYKAAIKLGILEQVTSHMERAAYCNEYNYLLFKNFQLTIKAMIHSVVPCRNF